MTTALEQSRPEAEANRWLSLAVGIAFLLAATIALGLAGAAAPASAQGTSACSDGVDNDGDGRIDHPNDPGCGSPNSDSEADEPNAPSACSDGVDNDNDGRVDYPADPQCGSPNSDSESDDPPPAPSPAPSTTQAPSPGQTASPPPAGSTGAPASEPFAGLRLSRRGCVRRTLRAIVSGERIERISVAIDGQRIATVPAIDDELVRARVRTARLRPGTHRLSVRVTFVDGTNKVLRLAFRRCR